MKDAILGGGSARRKSSFKYYSLKARAGEFVVDRQSNAVTPSFKGSIVAVAIGRVWKTYDKSKGFITHCQSFDGDAPAKRYKDAPITTLDKDTVEQLVSSQIDDKFDWKEEAVQNTLAQVTEGNACVKCTNKGKRDYRICPALAENKCKKVVTVFGYNVERDEAFQIEVIASSVLPGYNGRLKREVTPPFTERLQAIGEDYISYEGEITTELFDNFQRLTFLKPVPIQNSALIDKLKGLREEAFSGLAAKQAWEPDYSNNNNAGPLKQVSDTPSDLPEPRSTTSDTEGVMPSKTQSQLAQDVFGNDELEGW